MSDPGPVALEIRLGDDEPYGRIHVGLGAFCDFDAWIDQQTELLIDRWAGLAAPASCRSHRSSPDCLRS